MNFLNQINTWWIVGAAFLILIVQTVLFKLVLDRSHSSPADDPEPASADAASSSLPAAGEPSFATGTRGNRPRRRKHLQQEAATAVGSSSSGSAVLDKPVGGSDRPAKAGGGSPPHDPAETASRPPISLILQPQGASSASRPDESATRPSDPIEILSTAPSPRVSDVDAISLVHQSKGKDREESPVPTSTVSPALPEIPLAPPLGEPISLTAAPEPSTPLAVSTTTSLGAESPTARVLTPSLDLAPPPEPSLAPPISAVTAGQVPIPMPTALREEATPAVVAGPLSPTPEESKAHASSDSIIAGSIPASPEILDPSATPEATVVPADAGGSVGGEMAIISPASPASTPSAPAMKEISQQPEAAHLPSGADLTSAGPVLPPPSKITPAGPIIRRAVGPPRLFLTREFSSLRIRSRHPAAAPGSEQPAGEAAAPPAEVKAPMVEAAVSSPAEGGGHPPEPVVSPVSATTPEPPAIDVTPTAGLIAIDPPTQHPKAADEKPSFDRVEPPAPEVKPPAILEEDTEPAAHPAEPPVPSAGLIELPTTPAEDKKAPAEEQVSPPPVADESPREDSFLKSVEMPAAAQETPAPDHKSEPAAVAPVVDTAPEPAIIPPVPADLISLPQTSSPTPSMSPVPAGADDRASAQLTLSFEVSSLQLTPAFKLGSVQIRPLSNIVSLQLGAGHGPQPATNPLAANVSFEILSVQTGADSRIQSLVIRPLPQAQAATAPHPRLQVNAVQLTRGVENAPIQITPAQQTSTSVQVLATCTIAGIDFTPLFEIGSMRLEPNTNTVLLRLTSPQAGGADLPPVFEISSVQLGGDGQIAMVQLMPSTAQA